MKKIKNFQPFNAKTFSFGAVKNLKVFGDFEKY